METNNIADARYTSEDVDYARTTDLSDPRLVRIDRLRLLTDPGFPWYDISYCWGTLDDGTHVPVILPVSQFLKRRALKVQLVAMARQSKRFAKGLGLLDEEVLSVLR